MAASPFKTVIGLVDWHTAVIASGAKIKVRRTERIAEKALAHVERILSDYLSDSGAGSRFRVRLRLYAGWHSGKTPTDYHRGIDKVISTYAGRVRSYQNNRVVFEAGYEGLQFGNRLSLVRKRVVPKYECHFLDTLRHRDGIVEEKMTDTALVADLLGLASQRAADRYIVISDDDDMLPGLFAAEAAGADAKMLSRPGKSSKFMANARDLIHTYEQWKQ